MEPLKQGRNGGFPRFRIPGNPLGIPGILEIQKIQKESKESDGNPRNTMGIPALHIADV